MDSSFNLTTNLNIITALDDEPTDTGTDNLSGPQLQAKFDEGPNAIKSYINDTLVPGIAAANIPFTSSEGIAATNVEEAIDETYAAITAAAAATIPDGSILFAKINPNDVATTAEAQAGTLSNVFAVPSSIKAYVDNKLASQADAEAGTSTTKLMMPARVAQYITYIMATQAEAEAGVNTNHIMTPLRTKQAIDELQMPYFPSEVVNATWNESVAASTTVTKTIAHSAGAIPRKIKAFFHGAEGTACVEVLYSSGSYNYSMNGSVYSLNSSTGTDDAGGAWRRARVSNKIFGTNNSFYYGTKSLSRSELFTLDSITLSTTQISFSITNSDSSSAQTLASTVYVEVYP